MNNKKIKIASRNSPLALVQTNIIKKHLELLYPTLDIEIIPMITEGDRLLGSSLATVGGKGLFIKELERSIISGKADFAVHSSKDMPIELPDELMITTFYKRDDPRDVFVSNTYSNLAALPQNSIVGTASLRRQCLINYLRPDLSVKILRGNVQTRLKKLDQNEYTAIILSAAGLDRLGLQARIREYFDPEIFVPAVTQGIMCIECRKDNDVIINLLKPLYDESAAICAAAERSMNYHLQGGCHVPIGAYASFHKKTKNSLAAQELKLCGLVGSPDGKLILRATEINTAENAEKLGSDVAKKLLEQGAHSILQQVYKNHG